MALAQAAQAQQLGEVPVGAVLIDAQGELLATGFNRTIIDHDPTAHAEIVALRRAAEAVGNWRLDGCTVIVTLEPCVMCAGAILNARVDAVVIGASDEKAGAVGSRYNVLQDPRLLHEVSVTWDVEGAASAALLQQFFATRRS